jgi:hypothetical protein
MGNVKKIITKKVVLDANTKRGEIFTGLSDSSALEGKLKGNFSIATASAFPIYRWFWELYEHKVDAYYYKPPSDIDALKAHTLDKSLGNLLLTNLPGWTQLPDRETSVKVYSNISTANDFSRKSGMEENYSARVFRTVPQLNSKMVIAPAAHIRNSFQYAFAEFGVTNNEHGALEEFDTCFHDLFEACGLKNGFPADWQLFLKTLRDVAFAKIRPGRKVFTNTEIVIWKLVENKAHIVDFLDNAFSPLHNGFKVVEFNAGLNREEFPDNEIWTASPCLLFEEAVFSGMLSG